MTASTTASASVALSPVRSSRVHVRRLRRSLINILIAILATLLATEAVLRADPLGLIYLPELRMTFAQSEIIPSGWAMTPGLHSFRHWSATVLEDNTRLVPASGDGEQWVMLGDSLTFGYGVHDAETFTNRIAIEYPAVRFVNAGSIGYGSANVRDRALDFPDAARLIYLIYHNDAEPRRVFSDPQKITPPTGMMLYLDYFGEFLSSRYDRELAEQYEAANEYERFEDDLITLDADPRVTMFIFEGSPLQQIATRCCNAHVIPHYTDMVSITDVHPNAAGHQQIANAMIGTLK